MSTIASQITSLAIVYSIVYSDAGQRKHQSSASLAFVWGIHRGPVNSPHKWPVTRKIFPFDDVIMQSFLYHILLSEKNNNITSTSNDRHAISNYRSIECSFSNCLDWRQWNIKVSRHCPFVRGIHRWPFGFPTQRDGNAEMFPFNDVIIKQHVPDRGAGMVTSLQKSCSRCDKNTWHVESKYIFQPPNHLLLFVNKFRYTNNFVTKDRSNDNKLTLTPYMVLPLFATRFADYGGGIRVSFIQPRLF